MSKKRYFLFLLIVGGILLSTHSWAQYKFIKEISARADSIPHFDWFKGVATDYNGNIYAAEYSRGSVVIIDSTGKLLNELQTGQLSQPYDIAVDDSLYISTVLCQGTKHRSLCNTKIIVF